MGAGSATRDKVAAGFASENEVVAGSAARDEVGPKYAARVEVEAGSTMGEEMGAGSTVGDKGTRACRLFGAAEEEVGDGFAAGEDVGAKYIAEEEGAMLATDLEPCRHGQKEEGHRYCGSEERPPRAPLPAAEKGEVGRIRERVGRRCCKEEGGGGGGAPLGDCHGALLPARGERGVRLREVEKCSIEG